MAAEEVKEDVDGKYVAEEANIKQQTVAQDKPQSIRFNVFRALMWKNLLLKRKRVKSTCCELVLPLLICLLLIYLKTLSSAVNFREGWTDDESFFCPYTGEEAPNVGFDFVECPVAFTNFIFRADPFESLAFRLADEYVQYGNGELVVRRFCVAHSGNEREINALEDFLDFVEQEGTAEAGLIPIRETIFVVGDGSAAALNAYVNSDEYGDPFDETTPQCNGALVFESLNFEKAQFNYTLRGDVFGETGYFFVPTTLGGQVDIENGANRNYGQYMFDGWLNMQQLVDSFLISRSINEYTEFPIAVDLEVEGRRVAAERKLFEPTNIDVLAMPYREFERDAFFTNLRQVVPLLFMLVFLMPFSQIVALITLEKESRAREMMNLMGVSDLKIISAWYTTYFFFFVLFSAVVTLISQIMFPATTEAAGGFSLVIFSLFFWFGMSLVSLGFVFSTLFQKSFNAVVVALMVYIVFYFLSFNYVDRSDIPSNILLVPQVTFSLIIDTLARFEENDIGVTGDIVSLNFIGFNVLRGINWLVFDTLFYGFLGLYFNAVVPREFGTPLPFYFLVSPTFWREKIELYFPKNFFTGKDNALEAVTGDSVEAVNDNMKAQVSSGKGIQIRGMTKVFGGNKKAVDGLDLDVFEGQILVLLGHNGAGKTTSLQMLTGSLPMTSGEAFIYGNRVRTSLDKIRKNLGFCPQHNLLYKELTVYEHLKFYGMIKGVWGKKLRAEIEKSLKDVGLVSKKKTRSTRLSGGMKRKLSLAISLVGGSKVILVDEPTSGVDTFSRRSMWEILQNARAGRVIILTTHFMDEADLLGDRIAIMSEGKLQCVGSSLFLKDLYRVGYSLVFSRVEGEDTTKVEEVVKKHIPNADKASDIGTELSFNLPLSESKLFAALFAEIDELIDSNEIPILSYGVSVTTMEEVFLKAGRSAELKGEEELDVKPDDKVENCLAKVEALCQSSKPANVDIDHSVAMRRKDMESTSVKLLAPILQFWALFLKRLHYAKRDRYSFICNTIVPIAILSVGLYILTLVNIEDEPLLVMDGSGLNDGNNFAPIVELSADIKQPFDAARVAQPGNFREFQLEPLDLEFSEQPSGLRTVFTTPYENGLPNNCSFLDFFGNCDLVVEERIGDIILDIGEALLNPEEPYASQIEAREGASLFGTIILNVVETRSTGFGDNDNYYYSEQSKKDNDNDSKRKLQDGPDSCLASPIQNEVDILVGAANSLQLLPPESSSQGVECVESSLDCTVALIPLDSSNLCVVDSCLNQADLDTLLDAAFGTNSPLIQQTIDFLSESQRLSCAQAVNSCDGVVDLQLEFETLINLRAVETYVEFSQSLFHQTLFGFTVDVNTAGQDFDQVEFDALLADFDNSTTLREFVDIVTTLNSADREVLASVVNSVFNTTYSEDEINNVALNANSNFLFLEGLIIFADERNQFASEALSQNSAAVSVPCANANEESCVLIEHDLSFGTVCLPVGCSQDFFASPFFASSDELINTFDGITQTFTCFNDNCNDVSVCGGACDDGNLEPTVVIDDEFILDRRVCEDLRYSYTLLINTTANHIAPILFSEVNSALLRRSLIEYFDFNDAQFDDLDVRFDENLNLSALEAGQFAAANVVFTFPNEADAPRIQVTSEPLPVSNEVEDVFEFIQGFFIAIFAILAFAFVPGPMIAYVVMEKEENVQIKHLQFVSGVNIVSYWLSNFVFDLIVYLVPFSISLIFFELLISQFWLMMVHFLLLEL